MRVLPRGPSVWSKQGPAQSRSGNGGCVCAPVSSLLVLRRSAPRETNAPCLPALGRHSFEDLKRAREWNAQHVDGWMVMTVLGLVAWTRADSGGDGPPWGPGHTLIPTALHPSAPVAAVGESRRGGGCVVRLLAVSVTDEMRIRPRG